MHLPSHQPSHSPSHLPFSTLPAPRTHRVDHDFVPTRCPNPLCKARTGEDFTYKTAGAYQRKCDLRIVRRFRCETCRGSFSSQTFRVDYRLHKPWLPLAVFQGLVAKTSLRQISRSLGCKLDTVLHHLELVGRRGHALHAQFLARCVEERGGVVGTFGLDELETFELSRRLCPLTVPVLVQHKTFFVVATSTGTLPARGNLGPFAQMRKEEREKVHGKRKNESRRAVTSCVRALKEVMKTPANPILVTDKKTSYGSIFRSVFGQGVRHQWVSAKERRDRRNPLFTVNHTLAQMRDGLGRLVRRSWGHSKLERNLGWHLGAWTLWRNYAREIVVGDRATSSAMAAGVLTRRLAPRELFEWRERLPEAC
jgi:transposase-like protein